MKRPMHNAAIAAVLREMAAFYEMEGVAFRPAAYERAADSVEHAPMDAAALYAEGGKKALRTIPGVGEGIAAHVEGLLRKGSFPEYAAFRKRYPVDVTGLTAIENVGPKTVLALYRRLKIKTVDDLERAAKSGALAKVPGFREKSVENVLRGIARIRTASGRKLLGSVLPMAERMVAEIRAIPGVRSAEAAGSVRRRQETIGDLDIVVTAREPEKVMAVFTGLPEVAEVLEHGPTKTTVRLANGMQADVRVVAEDEFGAALQYFTGSKEHNVAVRALAAKKGLKLNEYGLWRGRKRLASRTEEDVYRALGMRCMPPEIRTDSGEIDAARHGRLPKLIPYGAVRGDLQVQTDWTDGEASMEAMVREAMRRGMEYIAVTDHTKALAMTGGLDDKRLAAQGRAIDALNAKLTRETKKGAVPFRVLKGTECDILKDGSLDLSDAALAALDMVGVSVHSHFRLSRDEQTARVIRALRNPHVDVLFHPTGRIIGKRDPYDIDMEAVLKEAKRTGTAMEIDAYPDRSDLRDVHVRMAVDLGVKLVIDTDAHHPAHMGYLDLGVAIARRGWASAKDVLNTRRSPELLTWLKMPKSKRR